MSEYVSRMVVDRDEKISRRRFISEMVMDEMARGSGPGPFDALIASIAVAEAEVKHPNWDMDTDLRTRGQWVASPDWARQP